MLKFNCYITALAAAISIPLFQLSAVQAGENWVYLGVYPPNNGPSSVSIYIDTSSISRRGSVIYFWERAINKDKILESRIYRSVDCHKGTVNMAKWIITDLKSKKTYSLDPSVSFDPGKMNEKYPTIRYVCRFSGNP